MGRAKVRTRRTFGAVRKLPSGRHQAKYTGPDGQWHKASHTFDAKEDAEGWLRDERRLISLDMWTPPTVRAALRAARTLSVDEAVDQWAKTAGHLAESSRRLYQSIRRNRITPYLSEVRLDEFTRADAHRWVNEIRRDHGGLTKRNVDAYKLLHSALQAEVDAGTLDVNPVQVRGATQLPEREEKAVPTLVQLQTIVANMPEHLQAGTLVAAWCGLRSAEWQELRRSDIERHRQPVGADGKRPADLVRIHVDRQAHKRAGEWTVTPPKGGKTRTVTLPIHLVSVLDEHVEKFAQPGRSGLLFPNAEGEQLTRQKFYEAFKARARAAGCPKVSPHSLRHFAGTAYAQVGGTTREIMDYLGHSSMDVAIGYQHTTASRPEFLAAAMAAMATVTTPETPAETAPGETEDQGEGQGGSDGE